jgi:hypothetical protein
VSNESGPNLPKFNSLVEAQSYIAGLVLDQANRGRIYNGYWRRLLDDVLQALPAQTGLRDATIFIGEIPDPTFNAGVRPFGRDRYLLLVQTGLELFLYRTSLAMIGSMRRRIGQPAANQIVIEPEIGMDEARSIVSRNVEALFRGKHEAPTILKSDAALAIAANYAYALQQFVIAHEIGHILQSVRPYEDPSGKSRKRPLTANSYLKYPWNQELTADAFGSTICHELITTVASKGYMLQDLAQDVFFEAPYIIFTLMEALDKIAAAKGIRGWRTHPPAQLRKQKLLSLQIAQGIHKDFQNMAEERSEHIARLTGLI